MPSSRKLVLLMSVSLDGFVARPDNSIDWLGSGADPDGARGRRAYDVMNRADTILLGGVAGPEMAPAWIGTDSPKGRLMNGLPKLVFSQRLDTVEWEHARVVSRPVAEEVAELKQQDGGDLIVFGGARFAQGVIRAGLVDEYHLTVHPVFLGDGLPLMASEPQRLDLISSTTYSDGTMVHELRPAG